MKIHTVIITEKFSTAKRKSDSLYHDFKALLDGVPIEGRVIVARPSEDTDEPSLVYRLVCSPMLRKHPDFEQIRDIIIEAVRPLSINERSRNNPNF